MAEKEPLIVIKKVTVVKGGHHGGSWKVALADFMTALMAFFLVMWLINQSEEVKQNVADYFSTPSIIEYNFSNYGVELTLEKLFLDLINEPLKVLQAFMKPVDYTPNFLSLGSKNIVIHHMADQLGEVASNVEVNTNEIAFDIPESVLFEYGTGTPSAQFIGVMEKVRGLVAGLEDANIYVESRVHMDSVKLDSAAAAKNVAEERLAIVSKNMDAGLEHESVDILGKIDVKPAGRDKTGRPKQGIIRIRAKQKDNVRAENKRELETLFGESDDTMSVYENFVKQITNKKSKTK